jgi:hypothetical protein
MSLNKNNYLNDRLNNILSFIQASAEGMGFHTRQGTSGFYAYKGSMSAESGTLVLDGSADLNGVYGLCKGMKLVDVPTVDYRNVKLTHVTPPEKFRNKIHLKQIGTIDTFTFAIMEEEEGQTNGRIVSMYFY